MPSLGQTHETEFFISDFGILVPDGDGNAGAA